MMKNKIAITGLGSISALGQHASRIWEAYLSPATHIQTKPFHTQTQYAALIDDDIKNQLQALRQNANYAQLDETVIMALYCARQALAQAQWKPGGDFGVHIGSSRGATQLWEKYHEEFRQTGKLSAKTSPTTTLGNISSWVGQDLQAQGLHTSHSVTCSTGLHALLNAIAWIQSGMAQRFIAGASEACITDFTLAQLLALKIYAKPPSHTASPLYPCRALDFDKTQNSMVLGEGACVVCLEPVATNNAHPNALAYIDNIGYASETLAHGVAISNEAQCIQDAMRMALRHTKPEGIDAIVMHAPGTIKGDTSEYAAIQKIFGKQTPLLTTNKWKLGHCFSASGMLSLEMALLMLQHQTFIGVPYLSPTQSTFTKPTALKKILINAVGFGGNAISVLLSK